MELERDLTTTPSSPATTPADGQDRAEHLVEDELLVEEISIDGMCGVY
jgi:mycofactocin precursor